MLLSDTRDGVRGCGTLTSRGVKTVALRGSGAGGNHLGRRSAQKRREEIAPSGAPARPSGLRTAAANPSGRPPTRLSAHRTYPTVPATVHAAKLIFDSSQTRANSGTMALGRLALNQSQKRMQGLACPGGWTGGWRKPQSAGCGRFARSQSNFRQNARSQSNFAKSQMNQLRFGVFFV
eukprot:scaffold5365_cov115-Isochrysis_galbana.AAC.14